MPHLVFAQSNDECFPSALAARHATAHFDLAVTASTPDAPGAITLRVSSGDARGAYRISVRPTTPDDVARARDAERAGKAAGMADLAARCPRVWHVEPEDEPAEWLTWECCALLAFVALGPVLPEDGSTLLGVRSARARAARLR